MADNSESFISDEFDDSPLSIPSQVPIRCKCGNILAAQLCRGVKNPLNKGRYYKWVSASFLRRLLTFLTGMPQTLI